jgi:hypothetical protein
MGDGEIDLRLIIQREFVAFERSAQACFPLQPLDGLHLDLAGKEAAVFLPSSLARYIIHRRRGTNKCDYDVLT